jgi:integrase
MRITIENYCGKLRLRWLYKGKRLNLSLGVSDDAMGHAVAKQKSAQIELDIQAGYFDSTLLKYKPRSLGKTATEITTVALFHRFTLHQSKEKGLAKRSLSARYSPLERHLEKSLNIAAHKVTEALAGNFVALQLEQVSSRTAKERIWLLTSGLHIFSALNPHAPNEKPFNSVRNYVSVAKTSTHNSRTIDKNYLINNSVCDIFIM